MGLAQIVKNVLFRELDSVSRPAQVYSNAAPGPTYTIFVIRGGLVLVKGLVIFCDAAIAGGVTMLITIDGVPIDVGATVVNSVINSVVVWPMDCTAAAAPIPNALCGPNPTLAGALLGSDSGVVAGPGNIVVTVGVGPTGSVSWRCFYRRIDPWASIRRI